MAKVGDWLERGAHAAFPAVAALVALVVGAPAVVAMLVSPDAIEAGRVALIPPCPVRSRSGQACPGCGLTRSTAAFAHGEWKRAAAYHRGGPFVFVASAAGAAVFGSLAARRALRRWRPAA